MYNIFSPCFFFILLSVMWKCLREFQENCCCLQETPYFKEAANVQKRLSEQVYRCNALGGIFKMHCAFVSLCHLFVRNHRCGFCDSCLVID